jgi:hypothetical protein
MDGWPPFLVATAREAPSGVHTALDTAPLEVSLESEPLLIAYSQTSD